MAGEGALLIAEAGSELAEDAAESPGGGGGGGGGGARSDAVLCFGQVGTAGTCRARACAPLCSSVVPQAAQYCSGARLPLPAQWLLQVTLCAGKVTPCRALTWSGKRGP